MKAVELLLGDPSIGGVFGDRNSVHSQQMNRPSLLRSIAGKVYSKLVNKLVKVELTDTQCGLKVFRGSIGRNVLGVTTISGYGFDVEVVHICRLNSIRIETIPVTLTRHEGSRVRILRDSIVMFCDIFRIRRNSINGQYSLGAHSNLSVGSELTDVDAHKG